MDGFGTVILDLFTSHQFMRTQTGPHGSSSSNLYNVYCSIDMYTTVLSLWDNFALEIRASIFRFVRS